MVFPMCSKHFKTNLEKSLRTVRITLHQWWSSRIICYRWVVIWQIGVLLCVLHPQIWVCLDMFGVPTAAPACIQRGPTSALWSIWYGWQLTPLEANAATDLKQKGGRQRNGSRFNFREHVPKTGFNWPFFGPNKLNSQHAPAEKYWRFWGGMLLADNIVGLFSQPIIPFVVKLNAHAEWRVWNQVGIYCHMQISTTKTKGSNNHDA